MNYWAIAPWPNFDAAFYDRIWQYDRTHGTIAIRWHQVGDVSGLTQAEIRDVLEAKQDSEAGPASQMLWSFYNRVKLGDFVVARRGRSLCVGIGRVTRSAYFDLAKGNERLGGFLSPYIGASFLDVEWQLLDTIPVPEMFTIRTVSNIGKEKFERLFGPKLRPFESNPALSVPDLDDASSP